MIPRHVVSTNINKVKSVVVFIFNVLLFTQQPWN